MPDEDRQEPLGTRRVWLLVLLAIFVFAILNLAGLGRYPAPHCDEVNHIAVSRSFFQEGHFALSYLGDLDAYGENFAAQGRLYHVTKGLVLELFDYSLLAGRIYSWLGWLLGILFTWLAGRRLFDTTTGLLGGLLFAISNNAFYASHVGREEIWVAALGAGLLYYYLVVRHAPTRLRYAFLGLLMVCAIDFHPNAIWYDLPLGLFILSDGCRTPEGRTRILFFVLAAGLAAGAIVAMQLLPDPALALQNIRAETASNSLLGGSVLHRVVDQIDFMRDYYLANLNGSVSFASAYFLLGIGYAAYRRTPSDRLLLAAWAMSVLGFTFVMAYKSPFYGIIWEPLLALLAGAAIARLSTALYRRFGAHRAMVLTLAIIAPLVAVNLVAQAWLTVKFAPRDLGDYLTEVREHVPPGAQVMADPVLWLAFRDGYTFTADTYLDYCKVANACSELTRQEADRLLDRLEIEYVVEDGSIGCAVQRTDASQVWADYLVEACLPAGSVDDHWFGAYGQLGQGTVTRIYDCSARH